MAAVEKILLQFEADIKDLKSELAQTKKQLNTVQKESDKVGSKMTNTFKNIAKSIGAAFSVQMVIQFTKKAVQLYDIQAKAEASLLQALKGRENVQRRLLAQASELQKITLFGDEETIRAQAMLAKFGMTETAIKRLIPLIQDYATISGQDLVSAADMVARSVGTSTNALTRYGIEINGTVGSAERLESAIDNLSKMVGGQAVAAAEAGAGAVIQFNNAWGDFAEATGEKILPAITRVTIELQKLMEASLAMEDQPGFFERFFTGGAVGVLEYARALGEVNKQLENGGIVTDESIFNKAQEDFAKWRVEWKNTYKTLDEAASVYIDKLESEIRKENALVSAKKKTREEVREGNKARAIQIEAIQQYVEDMSQSLDITNDLTKGTYDLSESLDKLPKILSDIYDPLSELPDETERWRAALSRLLGDVENNDGIADFYKGIEDAIEDADDANVKFFENLLKNQDLAKKNAENYRDAQFDIAKSLFSGMSDLNDQQTQRYIDNLQRQLDAGRITQGQFENERASALRKQAKQDKAYSVFRIILDTAVSIMNFLTAKPPNPFGAVAAGVAGAIQSGIAINQPLPAFAKGVVDLKGEGTETSDSIFARLSKGESVVTAKGTRQDKGLFEAANKLMLEDYINANYVLPALKEKQKSEGAMFDDYRLYLSLQNMKSNDSKNTNRIVEAIIRQKDNRRRYWA